jgi:proline dehydrogenase
MSGATVNVSGLTASKFLLTDGSKNLSSSTAATTQTEFAYMAGVTAALQTQINNITSGGAFVAKAGDTMSGDLVTTGLTAIGGVTANALSVTTAVTAASVTATGNLSGATVNASSLTASRLVFTDGSKNLASATSAVTQAELAQLTGATANIQTQINSIGAGGVAADSITFDKLKATASSEASEPNRVTASYTYGDKQSDGTTSVTYSNAAAVTLSVISRLPISIAHVDCGVGDAATAGERLVFCGEF